MIGKISKSGTSFQGAANYNQQKVDKGDARIISQQKIIDTDPKALEARFNHLAEGARTKNRVFHVSLNFSPDEAGQMTDQKLSKISKMYMDKMGYGNQPYVVYRHMDTKHPHVHILSSRVDIDTNKKINDSHEGRRSKKITDRLERELKLVISDKRQIKWKELSPEQRTELKNIQKDELRASPLVQELHQAIRKAPENLKALNRQLKQNGSSLRIRDTGRGMVINRVDANEKVIAKLRKGSDLKIIGLDKQGLKGHFEVFNQTRKDLKNTILKEMQPSLSAFQARMAEYEVKLKYSVGKNGINGMSFQYKGIDYKASAIDRDLSWNKVKDSFSDAYHIDIREHLKNAIELKKPFSRKYKDGNFIYNTPNSSLGEKLANLVDRRKRPDWWGTDQLVEAYVKGAKHGKVKEAIEIVDKFVQERYLDHQNTKERTIRIRR